MPEPGPLDQLDYRGFKGYIRRERRHPVQVNQAEYRQVQL